MATNENNPRNLVPQSSVPTSVTLGPNPTLDLSWLPEEKREQLLTDYSRGVLDIARRAQELHVDVNVLKATLGNLAATTREVADSGNAVTITHTTTTSVGRTEVIMGNTDTAQSGKLSRSQLGEKNWTPYFVFAAIAAVVLIAMAMGVRR